MNTINDVLQTVVAKNVPTRYQAFIIEQLSPIAAQLVTAENITAMVKELVDDMSQDNLVAAYAAVVGMKTEEQLDSEAAAGNEDMAKQIAAKYTADQNGKVWITNFLAGILLIAISQGGI